MSLRRLTGSRYRSKQRRLSSNGDVPAAQFWWPRGAWFMVSKLTQLIMISNQVHWFSVSASHEAGFSLT